MIIVGSIHLEGASNKRHLINWGWNCDVCIMHTCWDDNNHTAYSSKNVIISNLCVYIQSLSLKKRKTHTLSKEQWIERVARIYFTLLGIVNWVLVVRVGWDHSMLRKRSPNWCPSNRSDRTGPGFFLAKIMPLEMFQLSCETFLDDF
jgi:hypothetical protein